jgi:chemotaxis signal transduction protein
MMSKFTEIPYIQHGFDGVLNIRGKGLINRHSINHPIV